jgi:hypothetical protein
LWLINQQLRRNPNSNLLNGSSVLLIHKAGHAVIGRVLKQVCGQASVQPSPDEGDVGHTITADPYVTLGYWLDDLGALAG